MFGKCTYLIDEIKQFEVSVPGGVQAGASIFQICGCRDFKELDKS